MSKWKKKKSVTKRYDITSALYDLRYSEEQKAKYRLALNNVEQGKMMTILDAGCGTGLFFDFIADKSNRVFGLDISRKSLLLAKNRASAFHNVYVVLGDVDNLPFRNGSFSHVFAFTVLQNVPSYAVTLEEFKRATRDDGEIIVTGLKRVFSKRRFLSLVKAAGLRVIHWINEESSKCYVAVCSKIGR